VTHIEPVTKLSIELFGFWNSIESWDFWFQCYYGVYKIVDCRQCSREHLVKE